MKIKLAGPIPSEGIKVIKEKNSKNKGVVDIATEFLNNSIINKFAGDSSSKISLNEHETISKNHPNKENNDLFTQTFHLKENPNEVSEFEGKCFKSMDAHPRRNSHSKVKGPIINYKQF